MKLTKSRLKQIIKEELSKVLGEDQHATGLGDFMRSAREGDPSAMAPGKQQTVASRKEMAGEIERMAGKVAKGNNPSHPMAALLDGDSYLAARRLGSRIMHPKLNDEGNKEAEKRFEILKRALEGDPQASKAVTAAFEAAKTGGGGAW